ncbi:MAG: hypothetical protein JXB48_20070 [Candidatus Latescibacteria bacterium]|nr:hypothetical protein [Candidatus Latescibacterota bacterium]
MQKQDRRLPGRFLLVFSFMAAIGCSEKEPGNVANPAAVQEVMNGVRTTANAAWWGFNETDATETIQAAL